MYAFPSGHNPKTGTQEAGMNLRDYFAAKAMQSLIPITIKAIGEEIVSPHEVVQNSYKWADLMMKARDE